MGAIIALFLAIISLIYNIIKKNHIGANIFCISMPLVISGIIIAFSTQQSIFYTVNIIYTALALILAVLAILFVIKDVQNIKGMKSVSLIAIILTYACINMLSKPNSGIVYTPSEELKTASILTLSVTLLVILQINLFINLISNTKNTENSAENKENDSIKNK